MFLVFNMCNILEKTELVLLMMEILKGLSLELLDWNQNQKKIEIIRDIATKLTPKQNNKFYCQSLMDLANIICRSKKPNCLICPVF